LLRAVRGRGLSVASSLSLAQEQGLLEAARRGDEGAFQRLVEPHRGELHAHCYRMLGSLHDAEDALQDALLRAWRGLPRFEGRSSLRSWLYRLATNTSLDTIARRRRRVVPADLGPAADPLGGPGEPVTEAVWLDPYPDERLGDDGEGFAAPEARYERRESVELAFIAALQHLPARQRAVLILREVLGFSAREVADTLDTTAASVNSALQRARKTVDEQLPQRSQQATLRAIGDDRLRALVEGYVEAWERGDVDAVVAMLAQDAALTMPPLATWFSGREDIAAFLAGWPLSGRWRWRHQVTRASGQPAVGCYVFDEATGDFRPFALEVLTLRGDEIAVIDAFVARTADAPPDADFGDWAARDLVPERVGELFAPFGLPESLPG
jgi:RNA polymerase sigma-70 factor (ECF subfamily)